jgi:hypothetical protein
LSKTTQSSAATNPKVALYEKLLTTIPKLERRGDVNPYTAINGNMFTLLHQSSRLAIRLPEDKREEFLKKYKATLFEAYGCVMKEYVAVPDAMLKNTKELRSIWNSATNSQETLEAEADQKEVVITGSLLGLRVRKPSVPLEFSLLLR